MGSSRAVYVSAAIRRISGTVEWQAIAVVTDWRTDMEAFRAWQMVVAHVPGPEARFNSRCG